MKIEAQSAGDRPEDRTACVGSCMVCDPKCGVHRIRAERRARREAEARTASNPHAGQPGTKKPAVRVYS